MKDRDCTVVVTQDPIGEAAALLADALHRVLAQQDTARLAIPGGSALAAAPAAQARVGEDWSRIALTWTDERCVAKTDPASNWGEAERLGLCGRDPETGVPDSASQPAAHPAAMLPLYLAPETPRAAASRALDDWEAVFRGAIDIALLGLGEDGHIASLFPAAAAPDASPRPFESRRHASIFHVEDSPKPPADRITLSIDALATAQRSILVVQGESKRVAAARLVSGDVALPATHLPNLTLITDLVLEKQYV